MQATSGGEVTLEPGELRRASMTLLRPTSGAESPPTSSAGRGEGALYDWSGARPRERGEPFAPRRRPRASGGSGRVARLTREVTYRVIDQALGEVRRPMIVVPRVDVKLDPATDVWSLLDARRVAASPSP